MNKVVHFEIPADDLDRAKKFYGDVFNWHISDVPEMEYITLGTMELDENMMPKEVGGINGGMMKRDPEIKNPVITIDVPDIDQFLAKIKDAGGDVVKEKMEIPEMGFAAYFKDSEGNVMGLFQNL